MTEQRGEEADLMGWSQDQIADTSDGMDVRSVAKGGCWGCSMAEVCSGVWIDGQTSLVLALFTCANSEHSGGVRVDSDMY